MAFKRREGMAGGGITKYADNNFKRCPFCGTDNPHWLTDAYIANYSLIASNCVNGYKFQCEQCSGIFEIQAHTDFDFQAESFLACKLVDKGRGFDNYDKIGANMSINELKNLCSDGQSNSHINLNKEETPNYSNYGPTPNQGGQSGYGQNPNYWQQNGSQPNFDQYQNSNQQEQKTNGFAIAGLICAFFIPLLGWIFGGIGLSKANNMNGVGKGMSIAALIIATIMFIINLFYMQNLGLY